MNYSEKLKSEVKRIYPDWTKAHEFAKNGNAFLGRYLSDSCSFAINVNTIINSTSLEELKLLAQKEIEKIDLYRLWEKEAKEQGILGNR